jgi:hypothetical protein
MNPEQVSVKCPWWKRGKPLILLIALLIIVIVSLLSLFGQKRAIEPVGDQTASTSGYVLTDQERADIIAQLSATTTIKASERDRIIKKNSATTQLSEAERQKIIDQLSN